jgi:hypothetical protein
MIDSYFVCKKEKYKNDLIHGKKNHEFSENGHKVEEQVHTMPFKRKTMT